MASWWPWGTKRAEFTKATDAVHNKALRTHFRQMLDHTEPPKFFKASDVAKLLKPDELANLGYDTWQDAIPAVYELAWEFRGIGDCVLLKDGRIVPDDVDILDVEGPVRIMRRKAY